MKKYQVSEITKQIKSVLVQTFQESVIVVGEVSNFSESPSGHFYFSLKDEKSRIRVVFFKRFISLLGDYKPKNGDKVEVLGEITVYEPDGTYHLMGKKIEYDSAGDFYKKFEETKKKLESEGLFDKKRPIKKIVKNIGLMTSPTGAAVKDFLSTIKKNRVSLNIHIWPVQVQGDSAIPEIINTIKKINSCGFKYDVLILMRGGGSLEDLIIFNDEKLARTLKSSNIPTISAIGHERDFTICDFVADLRVSTPTAAADYISRGYLDTISFVNENVYKVSSLYNRLVNHRLLLLDKILSVLDSRNPLKIIRYKITLAENLMERLSSIMLHKIKVLFQELLMQNSSLELKSPLKKVQHEKYRLETLTKEIKNIFIKMLDDRNLFLEKHLERLNLLNPENILERGYAIVYSGEAPVASADRVKLEDNIQIKFKDGWIDAFVTGKKGGSKWKEFQ